MRRILIWIIVMIAFVPMEMSGQTRKRTKTKAKTTVTTKKASQRVTAPKTSAEAKKRQAETQKEIQLTEAEIKENEAKVSRSLSELGKLDQEITKTTAQIKELTVKVKQLDNKINTLEGSINVNENELTKLREEYLKAVKKLRITKKNKNDLAFIFSSKNMNQAMRRMRYLREFSAWRGRQTDEINEKIVELKSEKAALSEAKDEQQKALSMQKSSEAQLTKQHRAQEALIAELKQNGKALESHLKRKQAEARELGNTISQLIAQEETERRKEEEAKRKREEEIARERENAERQANLAQVENTKDKKKSDSKPGKVEKGKKPTEYADARKRKPREKASSVSPKEENNEKGFAGMRGKLPVPTTGSFTVTSRFGRQNLPDLPDVEYDNPGIDAETEAGASARAVYQGKVSGVYLLPGYNTVVIVNHGNYYTVYGNIINPTVKNGDTVDSGTMLGSLAMSEDDSRRSSIHFEVWKNREKLNPQEWIR